jgi:hypothetical protein
MAKFVVAKSVLFVLIAALVAYALVAGCVSSREDRTTEIEIVSLDLTSMPDGVFVLGTGTFNNQEYYVFYEKLPDGSYHRGNVPVSCSYIHEGNYTTPKMVIDAHYYRIETDPVDAPPQHLSYYNRVDFYVPDGTVVKEMRV